MKALLMSTNIDKEHTLENVLKYLIENVHTLIENKN
jgi:hypothetical protein